VRTAMAQTQQTLHMFFHTVRVCVLVDERRDNRSMLIAQK
jgi:hypothetical protein